MIFTISLLRALLILKTSLMRLWLNESSDLYSAGAFAINSALTLIGNLAFDAINAEDYSDEDARRDLILVSHALRHLPRMAQALNQSSDAADYVRTQRNKAGEQS